MTKKMKIVIIIMSCFLTVSVIANVYLGVELKEFKDSNKQIQDKINKIEKELKEEENEEEKKPSKENNESSKEENEEIKENENISSNNNSNQTVPANKEEITSNKKEDNELVGTWRYTKDEDVTTYVFKEDGTLWINDEYIDNYTNNSAICDNCLAHVGLSEIQFMIKDGLLYINFYKQTMKRPNKEGIEESKVYYAISMGSYVKATRIN